MPRQRALLWFTQLLLRGIYTVLVCCLMIVVIVGVGFLGYQAHYAGWIYQGVRILGLDVGGLSRQVERELDSESLPYVSLSVGEHKWTVSAKELGGYLSLRDAVEEAWALGRTGEFGADLKARARLLWWGYCIVPEFHIEPGLALVYLNQIAREAGFPARRAQLRVAGLEARTEESETGRELDIVATREAIERRIRGGLGTSSWERTPRLVRYWHGQVSGGSSLSAGLVQAQLVFREVVPPLAEVEGARDRVGLILNSPLMLTFDSQEYQADGSLRVQTRRWCIDRAMLASWLVVQPLRTDQGTTFRVAVDRDRIETFLQGLANEIARPPREARFDYDPQTKALAALTPGQSGRMLDVRVAVERVVEACLSLEREVTLPVHVVPPRVTRADLERLMPLSLIGQGQSSFRDSTPERLQDIRVASARFHGLVVPPQTTFSFLDNLGLVTVANGYSESWITYRDSTIRGPGGGVGQVSTACFRAAFWGGYPILERWAHSYRMEWCEADGSPVGLDAAVFFPLVDLKFDNDTDAPMLILTEIDEAKAILYVRFYGHSAAREVRLEGPVLGDPVKAGEPILEVDPSLSPGERVQVEEPLDGLDVRLYRVIEQDGELVAREEISSHYEPRPARYLVGARTGRMEVRP